MAENLANDISTTLNGAIADGSTTSITVTSGTGFPAANFRIRIDNEYMLVTSVGGGTNWTVTRGVESTTGVAHADTLGVYHILTVAGLLNYINENSAEAGANTDITSLGAIDHNNTSISEIKTATFNSQLTVGGGATTGSIAIDWSAAQNQFQTEPTGAINYSTGGWTAPPGVCHLQLFIGSDGTSTAQTITWPASVIWLSSQWTGVNNKKAIINFWYDGTNYFASGMNQV